MEVLKPSLLRRTAFGLAMFLLMPGLQAVAAPLPQAPGPTGTPAASQTQPQDSDSGGQSASPQSAAPTPEAPATAPTTPPVGTAVAPYVRPGDSGSRPSGAAIAPVKQKRIHTFAIRVGLLVGAGIAIGVVTAATLGSSSRPH